MPGHEPAAIHLGGKGPATLFLHGFAADRQSWLATAPALFELASVSALEIPGHGNAWQTAPADSLDKIAEQLMPSLLALAKPRLHLVGHSMGAALLLLCAAHVPEKVASITLLAPVGLGPQIDCGFLQRYPQLEDTEDTLRLLQSTVTNPKLISPQLAPLVLSQLQKRGVRDALSTCAQAILRHGGETLEALRRLAAAGTPRLIIWGEQDRIIPAARDQLKHLEPYLQLLPQCGHLPHIEQRIRVNELLAKQISDIQ